MTSDSNIARLEEGFNEPASKQGLRNFLADANKEGISQLEVSQIINAFPSQPRDSISMSSLGQLQDNPLHDMQQSSDNAAHASRTGFVSEIDAHGNLHQHNLDGSHSITTPSQRLERLQHLTSVAQNELSTHGNHHKNDWMYFYYGAYASRPSTSTADKDAPKEGTDLNAKRPTARVLSDVVLAPGAMVGALTDRPFSLVSVHDLKIDRQDGAVILVTNNGTALLKPNGSPVTAQELGKFMHSDGSIAVAPHGQPIAAGALHDFGPTPSVKSAPQDSDNTQADSPQTYAPPPLFSGKIRKFERSNTQSPPPPAIDSANVRLMPRALRQIVESMQQEPDSEQQNQSATESTLSQANEQSTSDDDKTRKEWEQREIAPQGQTALSHSLQASNDPDPSSTNSTNQTASDSNSPATHSAASPFDPSGSGTNLNANSMSAESFIDGCVDANSLLDNFQLDNFEIVFNNTPPRSA